jgi:hypothetical protein
MEKITIFLFIIFLVSICHAESVILEPGKSSEEKILEKTDKIKNKKEDKIIAKQQIIKICEEKRKLFSRGLADPRDIKDEQLKRLIIKFRNYIIELYEKDESINWDIYYRDVLKEFRKIAIECGINDATNWTTEYQYNFNHQINNNYFAKRNIYFDFYLYGRHKEPRFIIADYQKEGFGIKTISLPDRQIWVEERLLSNFYVADKQFLQGIGGFEAYTGSGGSGTLPVIAHNIDGYFNNATSLFFYLFKVLELNGINIKEKEFLDNKDIYNCYDVNDKKYLPQILSYKIRYRAWRKNYLSSIAQYTEEKEQLEDFARAYIDFSIINNDLHEVKHILQPTKKYYTDEIEIQYEKEAFSNELFFGHDIYKVLAKLFINYNNQYDFARIHRAAAVKILAAIAESYQNFLIEKEGKKGGVSLIGEELSPYLEGIDRLLDEDIKRVIERIKTECLK